jgi:phosphoribosylpyrophosphate synthetase
MVDDVQSFVAAAEVLKERGAYKIYVLATHGLLSSDAPRLIEDSPIDEARFFTRFLLCYYKIVRHR